MKTLKHQEDYVEQAETCLKGYWEDSGKNKTYLLELAAASLTDAVRRERRPVAADAKSNG